MKRLWIVMVLVLACSAIILPGCSKSNSANNTKATSGTNTRTLDSARIYQESQNLVKTNLLNTGYAYRDIENAKFSDGDILITGDNHWRVTGKFNIAGKLHSYSVDLDYYSTSDQYTGIARID